LPTFFTLFYFFCLTHVDCRPARQSIEWRSDGGAGRTGRHLLGAAKGRKTPKIKKNHVKIQIVSFMCLRARKTKRYGQRVPIVSYYVGSLAASGSNFDLCFKQALQFQKPKTKGRQIWPPPRAAKGPATPLRA